MLKLSSRKRTNFVNYANKSKQYAVQLRSNKTNELRIKKYKTACEKHFLDKFYLPQTLLQNHRTELAMKKFYVIKFVN